VQTFNVKGLVEATASASNAMLIFFQIVAIVNSLLSCLLVWISVDSNVRYNGWEVGVLRSIGISSNQIVRIYIYEAISVVLSAITLGTIVGIVVAIVLTLQFNLFLELPFVFYFPLPLFLVVFFLSIILSVLGAFIPANQFARKTISNVIRGM
jgi:ABC-type lipoprotein release transport system permease subunit